MKRGSSAEGAERDRAENVITLRGSRRAGRLLAVALVSQALLLASSCGSSRPVAQGVSRGPDRRCIEDLGFDVESIDVVNNENHERAIESLLNAQCGGRGEALKYERIDHQAVSLVRTAASDWQDPRQGPWDRIEGLPDATIYQVRMKDGEELVALSNEIHHRCRHSPPDVKDTVARCRDGRIAHIHVRAVIKSVTCTEPPHDRPREGYRCDNGGTSLELVRLPVERIEDVLEAGETKFEYIEIEHVEYRGPPVSRDKRDD